MALARISGDAVAHRTDRDCLLRPQGYGVDFRIKLIAANARTLALAAIA